MADAKINLTLSAGEFDLVRSTIEERIERCHELSKLGNPEHQAMNTTERRANNALGMQLTDLMRRLR